MKEGTKLEFCTYGFNSKGEATNSDMVEKLKFVQFLDSGKYVKVIATDNNGVIKIVMADNCRVVAEKQTDVVGKPWTDAEIEFLSRFKDFKIINADNRGVSKYHRHCGCPTGMKGAQGEQGEKAILG